VTYAEAAVERLGRPPRLESIVLLAKGVVLAGAHRDREAEAALRRSLTLAEHHARDEVGSVLQALGYLFEQQGRHGDAVDTFQHALTTLDPAESGAAVSFRERLATNLSQLGRNDEAERMAREALAIAERTFSEDSLDLFVAHSTLAQVLDDGDKLQPALAEADRALAGIAKIQGERSARYGEALELKGNILVDLGRIAEGELRLARACDVLAFQSSENPAIEGMCANQHAAALAAMGRGREALAVIERSLPRMQATLGEGHPIVGQALKARAFALSRLGQHALAIADLERALGVFEHAQVDPGAYAEVEVMLASELPPSDRARARRLYDDAIPRLDHAGWLVSRDDAIARRARNSRDTTTARPQDARLPTANESRARGNSRDTTTARPQDARLPTANESRARGN
jgi:tetratricopeptide (TPR) repeat protein